jgi:hypothetical protein
MKSQKVRQTLKTKLSMLVLAGFILCTLQSCAQNSETKPAKKTNQTTKKVVTPDYSKASNIIKNPAKLKGDEKAIFYHPYFLKLSHQETKNLNPFKVKEEFTKLGITTDEKERFQVAFSFFRATYTSHKKSCENWESFKDLASKSKN